MKINYITKEFLEDIKKQTNILKFIVVILSILFVLSLTLSIVFATYENRILSSAIGSIISSIILIIDLYFIFKLVYFSNFSERYAYILETKGKEFIATLVGISETITLNNNDKVKQLSLMINDSLKNFYIFDLGLGNLVLDKKYKIIVVEEYIKEMSYED